MKFSRSCWSCAAAGLLLLFPFSTAPAQTAPVSPTPRPAFVMADVHASTDSGMFAMNSGAVVRGTRYELRDATMLDLITAAYGLNQDSVSGGPGWLASDKFDVLARMPAGTTPASLKLMLQSLLADRFQLVIRQQTVPLPRYVLAVAKRGSKLKPSTGASSPDSEGGSQDDSREIVPGCKFAPGSQPTPGKPLQIIHIRCSGLNTAGIASDLHDLAGGYLNHDVIDRTNLPGTFDFDLQWSPAIRSSDAESITLFRAVEDQLGLTLTLHNVPEPGIAIVSVARTPSPNQPGVAAALEPGPAEFEAASIKLGDPKAPPNNIGFRYEGSQIHASGSFLTLLTISLEISPTMAKDVIVGLPKSAGAQQWDITAKLPDTGEGAPGLNGGPNGGRPTPPPVSVALDMLHTLLVQRFELKMHQEQRDTTVYALVPDGQLKATAASAGERNGCTPDPSLPRPALNVQLVFRCTNMSMADFAKFIQLSAAAYIDHPAVDATGLKGGWDFNFGWTPRQLWNPSTSATPGQASTPSGLSVFEATEKELGLKLQKETRKYPVWVVDHVDATPIQ